MSKTDAAAGLDGVEARVGHRFADRTLLTKALTHISSLQGDRGRVASYQRLEFLGDRVLGLVVSSMLYREFPAAEEGEMSRRLAGLVRRETCAEVAREWGLGPLIRLGDSEASGDGRGKAAILSDVCEALIGAIFLDGGYAGIAPIIETVWTPRMRAPSRPLRDPKTALQEWAQSLGKPAPIYRETNRKGPAHAPEFTVAVDVLGYDHAEGGGTSKRAAEQAAAEAFSKRHGLVASSTGIEKVTT